MHYMHRCIVGAPPSILVNPRVLGGEAQRRPPQSESYLGGMDREHTLGRETIICDAEHNSKAQLHLGEPKKCLKQWANSTGQ